MPGNVPLRLVSTVTQLTRISSTNASTETRIFLLALLVWSLSMYCFLCYFDCFYNLKCVFCFFLVRVSALVTTPPDLRFTEPLRDRTPCQLVVDRATLRQPLSPNQEQLKLSSHEVTTVTTMRQLPPIPITMKR